MSAHRACTKKSYPSKIMADFTVQSCQHKANRNKKKKVPIRSYKCPYCTQWHTTSQPRKLDKIDNTSLQRH